MGEVEEVVVQRAQLLHGPPPLMEGGIKGPCTHCTPLSPQQSESFQELRNLLKSITSLSSDNEEEEAELIESLERKLKEDTAYEGIVKLCDPSETGGCKTLLHIASDSSHYETMRVLLEAGADPNARNRWNQLPIHTVVDEGDGCYCQDCNMKNAKCVKLLLDWRSETEVGDWQGDTPLACSALSLMDDCANVLWQYGASIHKQGTGSTPGDLVASYIPDEVSRWFDAGIQQGDVEKLHLQLDFGVIVGGSEEDSAEKEESRFLVYISKAHRSAREKLLLHPLVQAYLHVKWDAVSPLFLFLRTAYLMMALLYTCFIISFFLYNCPYEEAIDNDEENQNDTITNDETSDPESCQPTTWIFTMSGFLIIFLICMIANEAYEMTLGLQEYRKNTLNIGWWFMIASVVTNILPVYLDFHGHWQYVVAAFGIFLVWGMFMSQLARDPKIGIYVEMLGSIVQEFAVFALTYFSLLVGFALGFSVLFPNNPMFEYVYGFLPLIKSLMMMIGELDYESLFDEGENPRVNDLEYSIGAHIIFTGFVIVVTILLANLLIGLTTSDVQELKSKAQLSRTERLVQQIALLETLFRKSWMPGPLKDWYDGRFSLVNILLKYEEEEEPSDEVDKSEPPATYKRCRGPFIRHFQPLRRDENTLPEELKEQFIKYVDVEECSKKSKKQPQATPSTEFCDNCSLLLNAMLKQNS